MIDFAAALASIGFAYKLGWTPGELVWGFLLMSFVRGIAHGILLQFVLYKDIRKKQSFGEAVDSMFVINCILVFMYAHFTFFHVMIAFLMNVFFPVLKVERETVGTIVPLFGEVLRNQWPMAVLALVTAIAHAPSVPNKLIVDTAKSVYGSILRIPVLMILLLIMIAMGRPPFELYVMVTIVFLPYGLLRRFLDLP